MGLGCAMLIGLLGFGWVVCWVAVWLVSTLFGIPFEWMGVLTCWVLSTIALFLWAASKK